MTQFSDLDLEIDSLLASIGDDIDDSPTINRQNLDTDYDGTPIIGKLKKTKAPVEVKKIKEKKDGRGRPQDKTVGFAEYETAKKKLGIIFAVLYKKFGQENISVLQSQHRIEVVLLDSDGYGKCERIRIYVGVADKNTHGRDKCKGRANIYERKGVFPMVELIGAVSLELGKIGLA